MWFRLSFGLIALSLYIWRLADPKNSYAVFYDVSDWITAFFVTDGGVSGLFKNAANLLLIEQADGFLLGISFFALVSWIFLPLRFFYRWGITKARGATRGKVSE